MKWRHARVGASPPTPRCPAGLGPGPHLFRLWAWHTDAKIVLRSNAELVAGVSLEAGEGDRLPADGRLCRCVSAPMDSLVIMHASAPQEIDCKRRGSHTDHTDYSRPIDRYRYRTISDYIGLRCLGIVSIISSELTDGAGVLPSVPAGYQTQEGSASQARAHPHDGALRAERWMAFSLVT